MEPAIPILQSIETELFAAVVIISPSSKYATNFSLSSRLDGTPVNLLPRHLKFFPNA
jgi:hypothetical protein